ncbi:hypothetical protein FIBSPDRAFT_1049134 [Athelia psychrophila]|uniref:DUF6533 domain-containing protein n=1 Tax=Athelia psychrophila TaxID=1759441 RepID=A0A166CNX2_9AGAM|nr:hypothetical protein FIBSPDRAFT_1049134 [Fibularhizoctonia sp. CBS 109695]
MALIEVETLQPGKEGFVTAYACVIVLTMFLLDWLTSLDEEVSVLAKKALNWPIVTYYFSRISSLGFVLLRALQTTSALPFTLSSELPVYIFWWMSASATSLLFFFRVRAVFRDRRAMRWSFTGIWALILVAPVASLWSARLLCRSDDQSRICNRWYPLSLILYFAIICHDTLIVVCVSYHLRRKTLGRDIVILCPLTHITYKLRQSGELYYGVTIGALLAAAITVGFGLPFAGVFAVVYVALASTMACKVFRMVMLFQEDTEVKTSDIEAMMMAVGGSTVVIR